MISLDAVANIGRQSRFLPERTSAANLSLYRQPAHGDLTRSGGIALTAVER